MASSFVNGVYYPSWRVYRDLPPSSLQLDAVSHVFYAFVRVNEDGSLRLLDEHADCAIAVDGGEGCLSALARLKAERPGLKTLVSVGGGGGSAEFPAVAASPEARQTFALACRDFVQRWGLDGVDIDWEHPETPADGANYLQLLHDLRRELPRTDGYLLSTALPVGVYVLQNIDVRAAAEPLDYLNLMGYDFNGPWTDVSGHQAQLLPPPGQPEDTYPALRSSCHGAVEYLLSRGFPAAKIVLGVPVYARAFEGAHGIGQPFSQAREMDYNEMPREWIHSASVHDAGAASFVDDSPGGKGFVSFDVPETVRQKAAYARWMGLAGLFYWTGVGDVQGPESLVRAGYDALCGAAPST